MKKGLRNQFPGANALAQLSAPDFDQLIANATTIERDRFGPKVFLRNDGTYVKLFRRKRLLTSALWYPYAARFVDNAASLRGLGIPAPEVISSFRVASSARDVVHYAPVPGLTLRALFHQNPGPAEVSGIREMLAMFVRQLFGMGIYFRSLHLGNVVRLPDGRLGLIDVSDLRLHSGPLSKRMQQRSIERIRRLCRPGELDWFDITRITCLQLGAERS